jgi:hypothetical protein
MFQAKLFGKSIRVITANIRIDSAGSIFNLAANELEVGFPMTTVGIVEEAIKAVMSGKRHDAELIHRRFLEGGALPYERHIYKNARLEKLSLMAMAGDRVDAYAHFTFKERIVKSSRKVDTDNAPQKVMTWDQVNVGASLGKKLMCYGVTLEYTKSEISGSLTLAMDAEKYSPYTEGFEAVTETQRWLPMFEGLRDHVTITMGKMTFRSNVTYGEASGNTLNWKATDGKANG